MRGGSSFKRKKKLKMCVCARASFLSPSFVFCVFFCLSFCLFFCLSLVCLLFVFCLSFVCLLSVFCLPLARVVSVFCRSFVCLLSASHVAGTYKSYMSRAGRRPDSSRTPGRKPIRFRPASGQCPASFRPVPGRDPAVCVCVCVSVCVCGCVRLCRCVCVCVFVGCLLYTSPSPRDVEESRMPSSA